MAIAWENIVLRTLSYSPLNTVNREITWTEEDTNFVILYQHVKLLEEAGAGNFTEYNNGATYSNVSPDYVSYNNQIYKYISPIPQSGVTPGTDVLIWEIVSLGAFAHERNKDQYLDYGGTYEVTAQEVYNFIHTYLSKKYQVKVNYAQSITGIGNSIMYGNDATNAYRDFLELVTNELGLSKTNYGISGAGIFRMNKEAFTNLSSVDNKSVIVVNPDINGLRANPSTTPTAMYTKVQEGIKALLIRSNLKTALPANDGTITQGGTWTTISAGTIGDNAGLKLSGQALKSVVSGSTLTFTVNGQSVAIGTFCTDGVSEISGSFTVTIDGDIMGTWNGNGLSDGITDNDGYDNRITQGVIWFDNLGDTNHTVVITTNSTAAVRIDYVGTLKKRNERTPLIVCETTKCTAAGYAISPANASDTKVDALNAAMRETVNLYSDEWPIVLAELSEGFNPSTDTTDGLHYTDSGHAKAAAKVLDKIISHKYLLGKLGVGDTPFAKVDIISTTNDPDLGNVSSWGDRHFKFGPTSSGTGRGLGISYTSGDNAFNIMSLAPTVEFLLLRFIAANYKWQIGNTVKLELNTTGSLILNDSTASYYIGDPSTNGSWRRRIDGSDLVDERRESGVWVEKQRIS